MFRKTDFIEAGKYNNLLSDNIEDDDLWINILEQGCESFEIQQ